MTDNWSWLKELKVGDPVLMVTRRYREGSTDTVTVTKVGRARITVSDGRGRHSSERVFRLTDQRGGNWPASVGHQEGDRGNYLSLPSIEMAKADRFHLDEQLRELGGYELVNVLRFSSTEKAQKVYDILSGED